MRLTVGDVLEQLTAEGLATADASDRAREALRAHVAEAMPWYLRALVGLGAWAATGFLLGFFFAASGLKGAVARILVGMLLTAGAVAVRRTTGAEFLRHAAVAASLAGQLLILWAIGDTTHSVVPTALAAMALAIVLTPLMPDAVHRFLSTQLGAGAFVALMLETQQRYALDVATLVLVALTAWVWRGGRRTRDEQLAEMLVPVGYALVIVLFALLLSSLVRSGTLGDVALELRGSERGLVLGAPTTIGITLALVALAWAVFDEHGTPPGSPTAFAALAGVIALGAGALSSPGIIASAAVLMLAFDRRNSILIGLGIVFVLVFGAVYYYNLSLTLLEKSGVLAGSGLLLLAIRSRIAPRGSAAA